MKLKIINSIALVLSALFLMFSRMVVTQGCAVKTPTQPSCCTIEVDTTHSCAGTLCNADSVAVAIDTVTQLKDLRFGVKFYADRFVDVDRITSELNYRYKGVEFFYVGMELYGSGFNLSEILDTETYDNPELPFTYSGNKIGASNTN